MGFWKKLWSLPNKIISMRPIEYLKSLANRETADSSHRYVNLIWGGGSFALFWLDHFIKVIWLKKDYQWTAFELAFIATMAGLSTISAIQSKKAGD